MSQNINLALKDKQEDISSTALSSKEDLRYVLDQIEVKRYGVKIDKNNSDPFTRCEYILNAVGMEPAYMDYENDVFNYGSWENIWFVKNNYPCMLNYDGTVDYKLNPNDYSLKAGGGGVRLQ